MRILLAEDDPLLGDGLVNGLRVHGIESDWVTDGEQAAAALASGDYAVAIIDIGLPRLDGYRVIESARRGDARVPVIVMTARDAKEDKLHAFGLGADDYLVKPVDIDELAARIVALARRAGGLARPVVRWRDIEIDLAGRVVTRAGKAIELTAREFTVLEALALNIGRVVSRRRLEEALYG